MSNVDKLVGFLGSRFGDVGKLAVQKHESQVVDCTSASVSCDVGLNVCTWDDFLQSICLGQFQQSGAWAHCKVAEGWNVHRSSFASGNRIVGGFQLLWRKSRLGRIGYVSKGPVFDVESAGLAAFSLEQLSSVARQLKISALILQPPDWSREFPPLLAGRGFSVNRVQGVIDATLLDDLTSGIAGVNQRMSRSVRKEIRQAREKGVEIREGGEDDIGSFFRMMVATCQRQGSKPNPATEQGVRLIWQSFRPLGARVTIARCRGEDVAGMLCIPFGERVTSWKKGWTFQHADCHPVRLLNFEGIEWACARGNRAWDYAAVDRGIARTILGGQPLSEEQRKSRHMFNLGFGGTPVLLPESRIWIRNPLLRLAYRALCPFLRK